MRARRASMIPVLLACAASCSASGGGPPPPGTGRPADHEGSQPPVVAPPPPTTPPETQIDAGSGPEPPVNTSCTRDVDVVFVMDVSLSMNLWFQKLKDEILVVDAALKKLGLPSPPHYGLVVFVDDVQVDNAGAPYPDVHALQQAFVGWLNFVSKGVWAPGFNSQIHNQSPRDQNYTWPENSLDAVHAAATEFQWRPVQSTLRMIIHTTDDRFWDGPEAPGCEPGWELYPQPNDCLTKGSVHTYLETIDALRANQIWVNNFAARRGGPPDIITAAVGVYRGTGVDVSPGFFTPYQGMNTMAASTGGVAWDIDQVLGGQVSLSHGINQAIVTRQCEEYPPPPPPPR